MCLCLQTSHFTPTQAGQIFEDVKPKLAVIHHATVNDASREALISVVRAEYPTGANPTKAFPDLPGHAGYWCTCLVLMTVADALCCHGALE